MEWVEISVRGQGFYSLVANNNGEVELFSDYEEQPQASGRFKNGLDAARHLLSVLRCPEEDIEVRLVNDQAQTAWKLTDNLFRIWYEGEVIHLKGWKDSRPTIGRVSLVGEVSLEELAPVVRWRGSINSMGPKYPQKAAERCVAEGLATGYHQDGQSGLVDNNFVVLDGICGQKVSAIKLGSYKPVMPSKVEIVTVEIADGSEEQVRTRAEAILAEERKKEAMEEWGRLIKGAGNFDAFEIERFNQMLASDYPAPDGWAVANTYTTGRGNKTVIVVRIGTTIRCPSDKMVRVLIGKGGENIRKFSQEHFGGKRINVIS